MSRNQFELEVVDIGFSAAALFSRMLDHLEAFLGAFYLTGLCAGCLLVPAAIMLEGRMLAVHPLVHVAVTVLLLLAIYGRVLFYTWQVALQGPLPLGTHVAARLQPRPGWWRARAGGWWLLHFATSGLTLFGLQHMRRQQGAILDPGEQAAYAVGGFGMTIAGNLILSLTLQHWTQSPACVAAAWRHRLAIDALVVAVSLAAGRL